MKKYIKYISLFTALVVFLAVITITVRADEANNSTDPAEKADVDMSLVFSSEVELTVYVDGKEDENWSSELSDSYGFGDTVTIEAPNVGGKQFSHWEADGSIISYANPLKLTMNAHTTLYAVYAEDAQTAQPVAGFTSITRTNDGTKISFQAIADGMATDAGIVYSTTANGNSLKIGDTGVTNVPAEKITDSTTTMPQSVLDNNNCWMLQITPENANTVYHARAYVTVSGTTTYGDVKDVKLSDLESGVSMVANLEGFEPGTNDKLAELTNGMLTVTFEPNGGVGATITQAFLPGISKELIANTFTREGYTFKGWSTKPGGSVTYTDGQKVTLTKNVTLYALWTNGSQSSGTAATGDNKPGTENYTIPVENASSVDVSVSISKGKAVVAEITQKDIEKVTKADETKQTVAQNDAIVIDLSGAKQEVNAVELTKKTVERLAETTTAKENEVATVKVQLTNATVELDAKTLTAVAKQAEGSTVQLVVEDTNKTTLNTAQKKAISSLNTVSTFEAYFESNGKRISDFNGGTATVSVKFSPEKGRNAKNYHMYYVSTAGKLERYATWFLNEMLCYQTGHFSDYAIVYDASMENDTGKVTESYVYNNGIFLNAGLKVSQTGDKLTVKWGKVPDADRYEVFVQYCGKKFAKTATKVVTKADVTSVSLKKLNGEKLKLTKNYKVYVVAYHTVNGEKQKLGKTVVAHAVGSKNTKYTNIKSITLDTKSKTLAAGKTFKIKAKTVLVDAKKQMLSSKHAPEFRYASSDKSIAKVSKKGNVRAVSSGTCYVWVYAKNGYAKKVKITVK